MTTTPPPVLIRPYRSRIVAWVGVALVLVTAVGVAAALRVPVTGGPEQAGPVDRMAVIGLGLIAALAVARFARPRVEADAGGVRVRNIVGDHRVGWDRVRAVRFDRGSSWATLELDDDDELAMLAVQAVDAQRAVDAVRTLRALHAAYRETDHRA